MNDTCIFLALFIFLDRKCRSCLFFLAHKQLSVSRDKATEKLYIFFQVPSDGADGCKLVSGDSDGA